MNGGSYNWDRLWCPRDCRLAFDGDGFLVSREGSLSAFWQSDVVGIGEVLSKPCGILLGEPGIGKSFAIRAAAEAVRSSFGSADAVFLERDLGDYSSDGLLVEEVFRSEEFRHWQTQGGQLHVFLDSFDECLLRVDALARLLSSQFSRLQTVEGLSLRIASRTADWQSSVEDALSARWGPDSVGVFELAPLTRVQVVAALAAHSIEPDAFLDAVAQSNVVSFAIKPLTLELLIRVWKGRGGSLPSTQSEIYEQGCLELCRDPESRNTPLLRHHHFPKERLAVAAQISAALLFCNRAAVYIGCSPSEQRETDISIAELATGSVSEGTARVEVTQAALRESLDTGLFNSRGRDRLGLAHQTYGEFLAARYLFKEKLTTPQVLDLLTSSSDAQQRLTPQLHETAAWAANSDRILFERIAGTEPHVLLQSDVATAESSIKAKLLDSLLRVIGEEGIQVDWWGMRRRYRKLCHPGLSAQISAHFGDRNAPYRTREEAIAIAEACELDDLLPALANIALDPSEANSVRREAAKTVLRRGDTSAKQLLRPLASGRAGADPDDELRAAGLRACWPGAISAEELFSVLVEPKTSGDYSLFVAYEVIKRLSTQDLPVALAWAEAQPGRFSSDVGLAALVIGIINKALNEIADQATLIPLARALLSRLRKHEFSHFRQGSSSGELVEPNLQRLRLVEAMVSQFEEAKQDAGLIAGWGVQLVVPEDLEWLIEGVRATRGRSTQMGYAELVSWIFRPDDISRISMVLEAAKNDPVLEDVMPYLFKPVILDSKQAATARELARSEKTWREAKDNSRHNQPLISPSPAEHISGLLDQAELGDLNAWWRLCHWLGVQDDGKPCANAHHLDVRELPGWKSAAEHWRGRMVSLAYRYILGWDLQVENWFSRQNNIHNPAIAGLRALLLLANESPSQFNTLACQIWQRWVPAILRCRCCDEQDAFRRLTQRAFEQCEAEAIAWAIKVLDQESKEGEPLWVLSKLPCPWPKTLAVSLLERARTGDLRPESRWQLLEVLLDQQVPGAINLLRGLIPTQPASLEIRGTVALCTLLMRHGSLGDWPRIWNLITANAAFGRALFEAVGQAFIPAPPLGSLSEFELGALWEWAEAQFPASEDRDRSREGEVTARDAAGEFRSRTLLELANRGSAEACNELARLQGSQPGFQAWFQSLLGQCQELFRRKTWSPPRPRDLFELSKNGQSRFVQSPQQLMEVVIESLARLQRKLAGERQLAQFLWDADKPKSEEEISDFVADHFDVDIQGKGIVIGREVQIRRDKTDIHVWAVTNDEPIGSVKATKLIVEVKGCWHRQLKGAMEKQLVRQYLTDNDCDYGVYLVGWFPAETWSRDDSRRDQVRFSDINQLESCLVDQAHGLSGKSRKIAACVLNFARKPRKKSGSRRRPPAVGRKNLKKKPRKRTKKR